MASVVYYNIGLHSLDAVTHVAPPLHIAVFLVHSLKGKLKHRKLNRYLKSDELDLTCHFYGSRTSVRLNLAKLCSRITTCVPVSPLLTPTSITSIRLLNAKHCSFVDKNVRISQCQIESSNMFRKLKHNKWNLHMETRVSREKKLLHRVEWRWDWKRKLERLG